MWYGCGLFSLKQTVPDGEDIINMNLMWCGCGFFLKWLYLMVYKSYEFDVGVASCLLSLFYFRHQAVKFFFIVLLHVMQVSSIQQTLRTVQVAL